MQEKFAEEIKDIATSIKKEFDIEIDRNEFIAEFCNKFEKLPTGTDLFGNKLPLGTEQKNIKRRKVV